MPTTIITGDQDALQLVNEKINVWFLTNKAKEWYFERGMNASDLGIPEKVFEYNIETVKENYGLLPRQIIDLKALEGDVSDNIPGVKGIGPSTSKPLLQHYGTIEKIYKALETVPVNELKAFFKEELGITKSPMGALLRKSNQDIGSFIKKELRRNFSKQLVKEMNQCFKESDDKTIKEKAKALASLEGMRYKEQAYALAEALEKIDGGLIGKEAAFLSKELATIVTNISHYRNTPIERLALALHAENMRKIFQRLEFHSLAV